MLSENDFTNSQSYSIDTSQFESICSALGADLLNGINKHYKGEKAMSKSTLVVYKTFTTHQLLAPFNYPSLLESLRKAASAHVNRQI